MAIPASLVERDKELLNRVSSLAGSTVAERLPDLSKLSQSEAGGVIRALAEGASMSFGEVATQTARISYEEMGAAAVASSFVASPLEKLSEFVVEHVDPVVGYSMAKYSMGAFVDAASFLAAGVSRVVANAYRDTMKQNVSRDKRAAGYQRVASANACAFCLVVSLNQYTTFQESGGYHDHCSCSTVPIFKGQSAYRPDYYDSFMKDYSAGRADAQSSKAEDILAAIRVATGRK